MTARSVPAADADSDATEARAALQRQALRLLARRDHSRLELARKLTRHGGPPPAIAEVIDALARAGLLREDRLAEAYAAARFGKGFGPLRVRAELATRGLSDALIEPHVRLDDARCLDLLRDAHRKRFGPTPSGAPAERARQARFLQYRGFPPHLIAHFLATHDE